MRWNFGTVYKNIRKSKGLSQKDICNDFISRSSLSKFENNTVLPRYEHMIYLLEQIDMSSDEFSYICNMYKPDKKQDILIAFDNLTSLVDKEELNELITKCSSFLKSNQSKLINDIRDILRVYYNILASPPNSSNDEVSNLFSKIWNQFEKIDTWYYYDIKLISIVLFFIPIDIVDKFVDKILKRLDDYKYFKDMQIVQLSILMNLSTKYLYGGSQEKCKAYSSMLMELSRKYKRYDYYLIASIRISICTNSLKEAQEKAMTLKFINEDKLFSEIQKELNFFKKKLNL